MYQKIIQAVVIGTVTCVLVLALLKLRDKRPTDKDLIMLAYSKGYAEGVDATKNKAIGNGHENLYLEMQRDSSIFYDLLYGKKGLLN
jgi:hypothetical protein